jgi:hypothetical protein
VRLQESGLKVKEFELLRRNFSETGNFGAHCWKLSREHRCAMRRSPACPVRLWH